MRVPQTLAIFSGIHQPFISNNSHCGRGVKSNVRGVPIRRISTFAESSAPTGASADGICGTRCNRSFNFASFSSSSAMSFAISSPIALDFAINGALSVAVGISFVILFFSAVFVCVIVFNSRTRTSRDKMSSTMSGKFFTRHAFFTTSGFSRINFISNIFYSFGLLCVCIQICDRIHCRRTSGADRSCNLHFYI